MSPIKKILKYFFHHSFSGEMVDRVHQRLAEPGDEREKEEALRDIWNEIGFPEADKRSEMAFARLENTLGVRPRRRLRIPAWVRIAAIWLIPLLSLGVSYYLYRDARDVKKLAFMEQFVPSGKRERITLPDGSEVWLNSGTLLLYPSAFIGQSREIYQGAKTPRATFHRADESDAGTSAGHRVQFIRLPGPRENNNDLGGRFLEDSSR